MIVLDTSAIMALILREPVWQDCAIALQASPATAISAATLAELHIVAQTNEMADLADHMLEILRPEVISVTNAMAQRVGQAHARWGRGFHAARLNYGDCFSYVLAKDLDCPLLFIGDDFSKTDVKVALKAKKRR